MTIEIETLAGSEYKNIANEAYHKALKTREPITFKFNGIQFFLINTTEK